MNKQPFIVSKMAAHEATDADGLIPSAWSRQVQASPKKAFSASRHRQGARRDTFEFPLFPSKQPNQATASYMKNGPFLAYIGPQVHALSSKKCRPLNTKKNK
jgi:hypothetical protein